jgi:2',3'-cyclic-nucleotide 2'-phosphodiesterase (5'-nucleotidase family)
MEVPLAELANDLSKKMPESTLGNMMADILLNKTQQYADKKIDFAVLNYGGIRIPSLTKGTLKVIHAYNLMPFDNYLVTQELNGQQVQDFCDSIALKKGWPVSGIAFKIKNDKAVEVKVHGQSLDPSKKYELATNDYLAGGGDGMAFLKDIPNQNTGVLFRDAIMEYWKEQQAAGKKIDAQIENRIIYVE